MDAQSLICAKTALLLHDPPSKMWLVRAGISHEEVAEEFANIVTGSTTLRDACIQVDTDLVRRADIISSSFDRWILLRRATPAYFVYYDSIHNIFDPEVSKPMREMADSHHETLKVAEEINETLRLAEERLRRLGHSKPLVALYNVLYTVLESTWYYAGKPPSLADTRTPTHTVFDHLYASASVANVLGHQANYQGYYVVIDYPGVQKYVLSGRKTGDFWAASWLISNLVWGTALKLVGEYGLDIILTPTPRLNPYTVKYVLSLLSHGPGSPYVPQCPGEIDRQRSSDPLIEVCRIMGHVYGVAREGDGGKIDLTDLNLLLSQPLIPATVTMLLPKAAAEGPAELARKIMEYYEQTWGEILDLITQLLSTKGLPGILVKHFIEKSRSVLQTPPTGLRITIVDVEGVYRDLEECLVKDDKSACRNVRLEPDRDRLEKIAGEIAGEPKTGYYEGFYRDVASKMLYHLLTTQGAVLARRYGLVVNPLPRSFCYWDESGQELVCLGDYDEPCSLCGEEPAVLKLSKTFTEEGEFRFVDYDKATKKEIADIVKGAGLGLSESDIERGVAELRKVFKPGEALGPYCLLKRAVYIALRDRVGVFYSTDDVALAAVSGFANREGAKQFMDRVIERAGDRLAGSTPLGKEAYTSILRDVLYSHVGVGRERAAFKDLEDAATAVNEPYERFVDRVQRAIRESCADTLRERAGGERALDIAQFHDMIVKELYGIAADAHRELSSISKLCAENTVETLCNTVTPATSYAILKADVDDVGKLLGGAPLGRDELERRLSEGIKAIVDGLAAKAVVTPATQRQRVLSEMALGYRLMKDLVTQALRLDRVPVSPAWHASISLTLLMGAVEDYKTARELSGLLVYSGGDDLLAFYPVHTALAAAREHRLRFTGDGFKNVEGGPVASSMLTGRSISLRFVSLKDVMSKEVSLASGLVEEYAKRSRWVRRADRQQGESAREPVGDGYVEIRKDSLVVSDSRSGAIATLPQVLDAKTLPRYEDTIYAYIDRLLLTLVSNLMSRGVPEDIRDYVEEHGDELSKVVSHVLRFVLGRNVKVCRKAQDRAGALVDGVVDKLTMYEGGVGEGRVNLAFEFYTSLFSVLRRYAG